MQIVIDIPEKDYDDILNGETKASALNWSTFNAIRDGIPLPKGHGLDTTTLLNEIEAEIDRAYDDLDGYDPHALGTFANIVTEIIDKYREKCKIEEDKQNK